MNTGSGQFQYLSNLAIGKMGQSKTVEFEIEMIEKVLEKKKDMYFLCHNETICLEVTNSEGPPSLKAIKGNWIGSRLTILTLSFKASHSMCFLPAEPLLAADALQARRCSVA